MTQQSSDVLVDISPIIDRIDASLRQHAVQEWIFIGVLIFQFGVGIVLVILGFTLHWTAFIPASIIEAAIILPVRQLQKARERNLSLMIFPAAIAMADSEQRKELVFDFIKRLNKQV